MEYASCNIIYVDRTAGEDRLIRRGDVTFNSLEANSPDFRWVNGSANGEECDVNLQTLLGAFSEVHICTTGKSCVSKLSELHEASIVDLIPTLVLLDIPYEDQVREAFRQSPSPNANWRTDGSSSDDPDAVDNAFYGINLLRWIALDIQQNLSRLVVPIAVVSGASLKRIDSTSQWPARILAEPSLEKSQTNRPWTTSIKKTLDWKRIMSYVDVGAMDVLTSPVTDDHLPSLTIHAYRAHKESLKDHRSILELKKGRKRSWVGVEDQKPYAYLREAMVSGLMDGICRGEDPPLDHIRLLVSDGRCETIEKSISTWYFSAHDFTEDELIHAAMLMLQHALALPALEHWRISTESLKLFLVACRAAYNSFVPYHNFRHVIDVLQATFHFLIQLGVLPPYPAGSQAGSMTNSPIAALLRPSDALTLLVTAIGHDVGHPGVNNAFLVTLNAPLAQLYNDRSVLESFHCAAYSQILRRYWPTAFSDIPMRQLMISSILATDMGLHFDYMKKLGFLQEKLHENGGTDGWNCRQLEEYRTLACALLIKCADISNVARRFDVATKWTMILTDEFSRQAIMEIDLGIPSALFAPPVREIVELGQSQLGFMNMFAIPLFQEVSDIMPAMKFCVDELNANKNSWKARVEEEQNKRKANGDDTVRDGMRSPRSMSLAMPNGAADLNHTRTQPPKMYDAQDTRGNQKTNLSDDIQMNDNRLKRPPCVLENDGNYSLGNNQINPVVNSTARHSSKPIPSQLQLRYATSSAPSLVDGQAKEPNKIGNLTSTDCALNDPPTPRPASKSHGTLRTSDTTDGSFSAPSSSDWASQATTATTNKLPLSPSTQGTSIMSTDSSAERTTLFPSHFSRPVTSPSITTPSTATSQSCPVFPRPLSSSNRDCSNIVSPPMVNSNHISIQKNGSTTIIETMRSLAKKPSRSKFRMSFWRRKTPPIPTQVNGAGHDPILLGDGRLMGRS